MQVDTGSSDTWLYPTPETQDLYSDAVNHVRLFYFILPDQHVANIYMSSPICLSSSLTGEGLFLEMLLR